MAKQIQTFFLEDWLRYNIISSSKKNDSVIASPSSAQAIIKAWSELREALLHHNFHAQHLEALKLLVISQASIYVADPQARILLLILSSEKISLPQESYPFFIRLLYVWIRKSRQTSQLVDSALHIITQLFSQQTSSERSSVLLSDGILLLGALSFQTSASDQSKKFCYELLCKLLEEEYSLIFVYDELATNAFAGIAYALSSATSIYFRRTLGILLRVCGQYGSVYRGLLLLHSIEWVLSNTLNLRSFDKIDVVRELLDNLKPTHSPFAQVMVAAGVLRAVNRSGSSGFMDLKNNAEEHIEIVARGSVFQTKDSDYVASNILLQCLALALTRSGSVSFRAPLLLSLTLALLAEVFPLKRLYYKVIYASTTDWAGTLYEVEDHLNGIIFKEAGSITGVCCNLYALADEDTRNLVEGQIWSYCQEVFSWHRHTRLILVANGDELNSKIEKIVESAFLMVVVFALGVTKHRLDTRANQESQSEISVRILVSFSCMEYFRRMRLPEYMDTIRAVIINVQENESACVAFVESMPSYTDLVYHQGSSDSQLAGYIWSADDVQTARVLFYMRVISTFLDKLPSSVFKAAVAPTMFLYMGHPNAKVARYSHTVFVAFISSGKDSCEEGSVSLKEQLGYYYLKRSLEKYPGITPFEGMASGVSAMVRYLPAGCPTLFYCICSLVDKARSLCRTLSDDGDLWNKWEREMDPSKKVFDLLLRLLSLTDIQVLPRLMKLMAELIVELPLPCQNIVLNQLFQQIAESDDVIRKPSLVSWVQSLSYLCSQGKTETAKSMSMSGACARL